MHARLPTVGLFQQRRLFAGRRPAWQLAPQPASLPRPACSTSPCPAQPLVPADAQNTGRKRGGETIWRLDNSEFDQMPQRQRKKLVDLQLPGLPNLGKHGRGK